MSKKTISPEDSQLFRQTIGSVRKIKKDNTQPHASPKPKPYPKTNGVSVNEPFHSTTNTELENVSIEDSIAFLAPGLQNKVLKKLRQGHFGIDAEIDLHGLNSNDAHHQLLNFIQACTQNGHRCLHIIHGKGYRSPDNHPVLKNHLNFWLRQHKHVQAFCSAPPKHGGTGAVFVLLQSHSNI